MPRRLAHRTLTLTHDLLLLGETFKGMPKPHHTPAGAWHGCRWLCRMPRCGYCIKYLIMRRIRCVKVGCAVGAGEGVDVGAGEGVDVGEGVGMGEEVGIGEGVGEWVGQGVGFGVGVGVVGRFPQDPAASALALHPYGTPGPILGGGPPRYQPCTGRPPALTPCTERLCSESW